jgi:4-hydroxybenzoate polyprenyltransferase
MQKLGAILALIRWPNLVFIALVQMLVFLFIIPSSSEAASIFQIGGLSLLELGLLILSTTLIAASGYMINDYFDIRIDQINKPQEVVLGKLVSRKTVLIWHTIINLVALLLVLQLALDTQLRFMLIQLTCIIALIIYSLSFKRHLFIGNLLIGILTSLSILCIGIYDANFTVLGLEDANQKFFWLYIVFSFLITLIRELIKDAEDIRGDMSDGCRTFPIVYGINKTKQLVYFLFLLLFLIVVAFVMKMYSAKPIMCAYYIIGIVIPSIVIMLKIKPAMTQTDFGILSRWIKWLTLSGILSMILVAL